MRPQVPPPLPRYIRPLPPDHSRRKLWFGRKAGIGGHVCGTAEARAKYPRFLGGERRCPPEDCGGPPGYFDFIENIASKQSNNTPMELEWRQGSFLVIDETGFLKQGKASCGVARQSRQSNGQQRLRRRSIFA